MLLSWIGAILIILNIVYMVLGNCMRIIMWLKCIRVRACNNQRCLNKGMCSKYYDQLTDEECKELSNMIDDFRNKEII